MKEIGVGLWCWSLPHPQWAPEDFEDGVNFVELASLSAPEHVAEGAARALGLRPGGLSPTCTISSA